MPNDVGEEHEDEDVDEDVEWKGLGEGSAGVFPRELDPAPCAQSADTPGITSGAMHEKLTRRSILGMGKWWRDSTIPFPFATISESQEEEAAGKSTMQLNRAFLSESSRPASSSTSTGGGRRPAPDALTLDAKLASFGNTRTI